MKRAFEIFVCLFLFVVTSCSSDDKELVPTLSESEITMEIGDSKMLIVYDAKNVSATATTSIVNVVVTDNIVEVIAIKPGTCDVRIVANGHRLQCKVVVVDNSQPEEDIPESPEDEYDFSAELQNATSRYVSTALSLTYEDVGTLFSIENGNCISIMNIDNGDNVNFSFDGNVAEGILNAPKLKINGNVIEISQAKIEQLNSSGMWIHITTNANEHITLVVTDL